VDCVKAWSESDAKEEIRDKAQEIDALHQLSKLKASLDGVRYMHSVNSSYLDSSTHVCVAQAAIWFAAQQAKPDTVFIAERGVA
jgi:hypothetical protein